MTRAHQAPRCLRQWSRLLALGIALALVTAGVPRALADSEGDDGLSFFGLSSEPPDQQTQAGQLPTQTEQAPADVALDNGGEDGTVTGDATMSGLNQSDEARPATPEVVAEAGTKDTGEQSQVRDQVNQEGQTQPGGPTPCAGAGCPNEPTSPGSPTVAAGFGSGIRDLIARSWEAVRSRWSPQQPEAPQEAAQSGPPMRTTAEVAQDLDALEARLREAQGRLRGNVQIAQDDALHDQLQREVEGLRSRPEPFSPDETRHVAGLSRRLNLAGDQLEQEREAYRANTPTNRVSWALDTAEILAERAQSEGSRREGQANTEDAQAALEQALQRLEDLGSQPAEGQEATLAELRDRAERLRKTLAGGSPMSMVELDTRTPGQSTTPSQQELITGTGGTRPLTAEERALIAGNVGFTDASTAMRPWDPSPPPSRATSQQEATGGLTSRLEAAAQAAAKNPDAVKAGFLTALGLGLVGFLATTPAGQALLASFGGLSVVPGAPPSFTPG
ncbi:MAG TPA: hypothetical protein VKG45_12490 [Actinomycetes bacterium]|nr:hypothetical protein [Actinomycetes bacterium]